MASLEAPGSRSEDMVRKNESEGLHRFSFSDPRLQVYLIKFVYPNDPEAATKWLEGGTLKRGDTEIHVPPLSAAFREYVDTVEGSKVIDISDAAQMQELFDAVLERAQKNLH